MIYTTVIMKNMQLYLYTSQVLRKGAHPSGMALRSLHLCVEFLKLQLKRAGVVVFG